jgi:DNA-binding MarR family transcriptional regulator
MASTLPDGLVRVAFDVAAAVGPVAARHDLSLTQLRVLGILRDRTLRMSELADYLGLDRSTVTGLVDRAQARGLVERVRDPADGRAARVALTPAAHELRATIEREVTEAVGPLLSQLGPTQGDALGELLHSVGRLPNYRKSS